MLTSPLRMYRTGGDIAPKISILRPRKTLAWASVLTPDWELVPPGRTPGAGGAGRNFRGWAPEPDTSVAGTGTLPSGRGYLLDSVGMKDGRAWLGVVWCAGSVGCDGGGDGLDVAAVCVGGELPACPVAGSRHLVDGIEHPLAAELGGGAG
jgi:hypothetical protein